MLWFSRIQRFSVGRWHNTKKLDYTLICTRELILCLGPLRDAEWNEISMQNALALSPSSNSTKAPCWIWALHIFHRDLSCSVCITDHIMFNPESQPTLQEMQSWEFHAASILLRFPMLSPHEGPLFSSSKNAVSTWILILLLSSTFLTAQIDKLEVSLSYPPGVRPFVLGIDEFGRV